MYRNIKHPSKHYQKQRFTLKFSRLIFGTALIVREKSDCVTEKRLCFF